MLSPQGQDGWVRVEQILVTVTKRGRYLGEIDLVRNQPLVCQAYLIRKKPGNRKRGFFNESVKMAEVQGDPINLQNKVV